MNLSVRGFIRKKRERFETLLNAIIRKEEFLTNSIVLRIKEDGEEDYRYCNFTYCPKEDEAGRVVVITFIQQDITEDIIYQQNLILAKNRAEEADKLKSAFLANMSHEIRTPLNAIVGFSELLSDTDEPSEKNEYKQLIETNSDILLRLIGDILDLSKIEAGSIDIKRQDLDLLQLCNELYLSFQQRIKNPAVTLKLINPYSKCIAEFDKYRFIQIFTNFVTNAIKYTPSGEIVMGYECEPGKVRLYVKDTGIGIPDKKKNRIFSRFEKLDNFAQVLVWGFLFVKRLQMLQMVKSVSSLKKMSVRNFGILPILKLNIQKEPGWKRWKWRKIYQNKTLVFSPKDWDS